MKLLITGSKGFVGKNLVIELKHRGFTDISEYDVDSDPALLDDFCEKADFVFHLAGVNRPKDPEEFMRGNFGFTSVLLDTLKRHRNACPVLISSSTQAALDNPYGLSKKAGEDLLFSYARETGSEVLVYRLPNVFGKWCRHNYNSAVATFCNNIAGDLPIQINDRSVNMNLVYVDDVVEEMIMALQGSPNREGAFCAVKEFYSITLGEIVDLLYSFKASREERSIPNMSDVFTSKLYSTYLSYLPADRLSYPLKMNNDARGSFTEFLRTPERGQVSVNISVPGIVKGNHWHQSKNEKFLVVSGQGIIRFRKVASDDIIEYSVSGKKLEVLDIPPGYAHNIENTGDCDMVTIMWANECFDPQKSDTYYEEV
jgi:UDP-2-acetamido-2,6-beta-L-arabino-hexul-4-ose reductase